VVRIVVALLFLEHGQARKLLGFPTSPHGEPAFMTLMWISGADRVRRRWGSWRWVFFTRDDRHSSCPATWPSHISWVNAVKGLLPAAQMGGDAAILYCFVFLLFFVAGPGRWSLDAETDVLMIAAAITRFAAIITVGETTQAARGR